MEQANRGLMYGRQARNPLCARCKNHGTHVKLKGHKAYCPFKDCQCRKCIVVAFRQKIMAKNVAMRRREELDEKRQDQQGFYNLKPQNDEVISDGRSSSANLRENGTNELSVLTLFILNFYNNDAKMAAKHIKQVTFELTNLADNLTDDSVKYTLPASLETRQQTDAPPFPHIYPHQTLPPPFLFRDFHETFYPNFPHPLLAARPFPPLSNLAFLRHQSFNHTSV